jgi:hypothetical protein
VQRREAEYTRATLMSPEAIAAMNETWNEARLYNTKPSETVAHQCLLSHTELRRLAFERVTSKQQHFDVRLEQVELVAERLQLVA